MQNAVPEQINAIMFQNDVYTINQTNC